MHIWRAVDHEGEILDILVQRRRDKRAELRLMRKLFRKQGFVPKLLTTDKLGSYGCFPAPSLDLPSRAGGCEQTIAPRIPIKRCADASARSNDSSQFDPRSASSVSMPPSTTHSICNDTSSHVHVADLSRRSRGAVARCRHSSMTPGCLLPSRLVDSYRDKPLGGQAATILTDGDRGLSGSREVLVLPVRLGWRRRPADPRRNRSDREPPLPASAVSIRYAPEGRPSRSISAG